MKKQRWFVLGLILVAAMVLGLNVPVTHAQRGDPPARLATPAPVTVVPGAATATPTATPLPPTPTPVYTPIPIPTFSFDPILPTLIQPRFRSHGGGAFVNDRFDR